MLHILVSTVQSERQALTKGQQPLATTIRRLFDYQHQYPIYKPKIVSEIQNVTVTAGRDAILTCAVDNLGSYNIAWIKVDTQTILTVQIKVITHDSRFRITQNNYHTWFLHIDKVNTVPMNFKNAFLQVLVPPSILQDKGTSDDVVVQEFSSVSLFCKASGHPTPTITWQREDNRRIYMGWGRSNHLQEETIEGEYLNLTRVTREHMGAYLCIAYNGVPPSVSKRIVLKVHFKPKISVPNQLIGAPLHSQISLLCEVEGFPLPMTSWRKYNDLIMSNNKQETSVVEKNYKLYMTLKIRSLQIEDFGAYKCCATNTLGEREGLIRLYRQCEAGITMLLPEPEELYRRSYDGLRCPHEWSDVFTIRAEFEHVLYRTLADTADSPRAYKGHHPDRNLKSSQIQDGKNISMSSSHNVHNDIENSAAAGMKVSSPIIIAFCIAQKKTTRKRMRVPTSYKYNGTRVATYMQFQAHYGLCLWGGSQIHLTNFKNKYSASFCFQRSEMLIALVS
ncbi:Lachesin [Nymphon striatum]|nr:Lachesin [Nymphon striatum]